MLAPEVESWALPSALKTSQPVTNAPCAVTRSWESKATAAVVPVLFSHTVSGRESTRGGFASFVSFQSTSASRAAAEGERQVSKSCTSSMRPLK